MMARNNYFKVSSRESDLFEQLVIEQIKIFGFDLHYIFRKFQKLDTLFGEDPISKFQKSFQIEMYVSNYEFFETQNKLIDKFGINLQDSITLLISKKRFAEEVTRYGTDIKPEEGDLIYFPEYGGLYEIKYVAARNSFFSYEITCELFRYSGEDIVTEIQEVDVIEIDLVTPIRKIVLSDSSAVFMEGETIYQGSSLASKSYSAVIINIDSSTNSIDVRSEVGTPTSLLPINGVTSLAMSNYASIGTTEKTFINNSNADDTSAMELERIKQNIIDFSDIDPFSEGNY